MPLAKVPTGADWPDRAPGFALGMLVTHRTPGRANKLGILGRPPRPPTDPGSWVGVALHDIEFSISS